jgi:hypothetical protein
VIASAQVDSNALLAKSLEPRKTMLLQSGTRKGQSISSSKLLIKLPMGKNFEFLQNEANFELC